MTSESDNGTQPIDVQSEKNFQRFLENLAYPSVIHSNGKYVYANKAAAKLYKASSPKALIGKNTLDIIHKDFKKVTRERIKEVYERGFTPERENLIVDKEGKTIIVQIAGTLIDYKGNPSVLFTLQNLAGERKAEEELQVSESQYRQLVENINEGIIKFDAKEVITYVNKQFCELVGYPSKELVGKAGRQLLFTTKESKEIARRVLKQRLQGASSKYEVQILTKAKKLVWVSMNGVPILDEDGNYGGAMELVTDISHSKKRQLALELSEQRFTGLSKATFDAVAIHDQGEILVVNDAFHKLFGYKPSEVIGRMVTEFCTPESREILMDNTRLQKEEPYVAMGLRKDKSTFYAEICGKAIVYQDRNARVATIRDITEQKLSEDALFESASRYKSLFENANDLIQNVDPKGKFLFVNDAWLTTLGYDKSDLQKLTMFDIIHKESLDHCMQIFERVISGKTVRGIDATFVKKNGDLVEVHGNVTRYESKTGQIMTQGVFANVTQDRLARTKEKKSKERYLGLVNNMNEGVLQVDNDENIEYVNNQFCDMLGYTREELVGQDANALFSVSRNDSNTMKENVNERQQGVSSRYEMQMRTKTGGVIWVSVSGAPVYDGDGKVIGSIGINMDITSKKRIEEEINALNAGLEERVEERTVELEKANKEIRSLLQEMHHRVKNNLQIVSSLLNVQAASVDDEYITRVFRESQDRIQTMSFIHESMYLNESMSEISVMDYLEPLIKDRVKVNADLLSKIVLDIKFPDVNFNIDTMLPIGLLLNELVTNSLKHAFPDNQEGKITVGLDILPDKSAVLYYSDNGVGFSIENAGDTSKSLGLILIDSFAMQLDGKLKRLDKPGTYYELKFKPI